VLKMQDNENELSILETIAKTVQKLGADDCDAICVKSISLSIGQRMGIMEKIERSESSDIGVRVFIGQKQAIVSSSDLTKPALQQVAERAVAMARAAPEDSYCGLASKNQLSKKPADIDSFDPVEPDADTLIRWTQEAEEAALSVTGVTNSEGAEADWGKGVVSVYATNGFAQTYKGSHYSLSASVLAGSGTEMERDYEYSGSVYGTDLMNAEDLGKIAGNRAVQRLEPRKIKTSQVPVVFDSRISRSLISHLAGAINGSAIARNTSFLLDKMNKKLFQDDISIVDEPHRARGLRSVPFDSEGLSNKTINIVEGGVLKSWLLDLRSSRQLKLHSTGHASRGVSSLPSPSPTNLYLKPGKESVTDLIAPIQEGFFVNELIGSGVNGLTGDYSRGASGFWIEKGKISFPVSEVTIAGNLLDMYKNLSPANDLDFRYGIDAPTCRVDGMTVAGK
jgi:PmbA protein